MRLGVEKGKGEILGEFRVTMREPTLGGVTPIDHINRGRFKDHSVYRLFIKVIDRSMVIRRCGL
jgi:hypothetical protein